jgi:enoyl-CoA hydratase
MAEQLCDNAPLSLKAATRSLRDLQECLPEEEAMLKQDEIGWPIFATQDSKEGMKAFKEKRKADFKGR